MQRDTFFAENWKQLITIIRGVTEDSPANTFCEYDARVLENAAAEIRRKLAEVKKGK